MVVATLGDSITEGSPEFDRRRGGDERSQWQYWAARAEPRLSFRNCGAYGERTDEISARFEVCVAGADVVVVQGGINDIAQGRSVHTAAQTLRSMVLRARDLGLRAAIADVLPWNNGPPDAERRIRELNGLIAEIAADEDVLLLRFHSEVEDPERPGRMRVECSHADGDHPSVEGYRQLGELAARALTTFLAD